MFYKFIDPSAALCYITKHIAYRNHTIHFSCEAFELFFHRLQHTYTELNRYKNNFFVTIKRKPLIYVNMCAHICRPVVMTFRRLNVRALFDETHTKNGLKT